MATLKDVAQRAGVTVTTVSRMLNDRARVSEKTRLRIRTAMEELDYHPNELARSLAKKISHFIGLIVPSADNFFFSCVIASVERYASAGGYKLLLCVSNHEIQKRRNSSACFWEQGGRYHSGQPYPEPGGVCGRGRTRHHH